MSLNCRTALTERCTILQIYNTHNQQAAVLFHPKWCQIKVTNKVKVNVYLLTKADLTRTIITEASRDFFFYYPNSCEKEWIKSENKFVLSLKKEHCSLLWIFLSWYQQSFLFSGQENTLKAGEGGDCWLNGPHCVHFSRYSWFDFGIMTELNNARSLCRAFVINRYCDIHKYMHLQK